MKNIFEENIVTANQIVFEIVMYFGKRYTVTGFNLSEGVAILTDKDGRKKRRDFDSIRKNGKLERIFGTLVKIK